MTRAIKLCSGYKCLVFWEHEIREYSDDTLALFLIDLLMGKINDKFTLGPCHTNYN